MASMAEDANEQAVTFDILDNSVLSVDIIIDGDITEAEKEEMYAIVEQIDGVNSRELIDFTSQEFAPPAKPCHKVVTENELDWLAGKNMAENTLYQTKWATTVMKGTLKLVKHDFSNTSGIWQVMSRCDEITVKFTFFATLQFEAHRPLISSRKVAYSS